MRVRLLLRGEMIKKFFLLSGLAVFGSLLLFGCSSTGSSDDSKSSSSQGDLSTNADLSELIVSEGKLTPSFHPDTVKYAVKVSYEVSSITVTGIADQSEATLSKESGAEQKLKVGTNPIVLTVTAPDEVTEKRYLVTVTRLKEGEELPKESSSSGSDQKDNGTSSSSAAGSQNGESSSSSSSRELSGETSLNQLAASVGTLPFHRDSLNYSLSLPYEIDRITLIASAMSAQASLSGDVDVEKPLQVGDNTLSITVTAENGDQKSYTVQVRRRISVALTGLTVSSGSLNPSFHTDSTSYLADVSSELTVTATPQSSEASIVLERMSGSTVVESYSNGTLLNFPDLPIELVTILVRVTGEMSDAKTYTLVLKKDWCLTVGNCETFTDSRDNQIYKWTKIGTQIWMAENLNFGTRVDGTADQKDATSSSAEKYCYNDDETNCTTYGGLYQWHSAMALPQSCNHNSGCIDTPHRGICPEGWHFPTQEEWGTLDTWVDNDNDGAVNNNEGISLKSVSGWTDSKNRTDAYGWIGLPAGYRGYPKSFINQGSDGVWWSTSESVPNQAWGLRLNSDSGDLSKSYYVKSGIGFSIRCVKD